MQSPQDASRDVLDAWIAEVGEDHIAGLVEQIKRDVADGTIPTFSGPEALLEHLDRAVLDERA